MKSTLVVQNLKCKGCANSIIKALEKLDSVSKVVVEVTSSKIQVTHENLSNLNSIEENLSNLNSIEEKLAYLGYPKEYATNSLTTKAKSFVSCGIGRFSNS